MAFKLHSAQESEVKEGGMYRKPCWQAKIEPVSLPLSVTKVIGITGRIQLSR
jgi:hypothetical protein